MTGDEGEAPAPTTTPPPVFVIDYHAGGPLLASALALAIEIGASAYDGLFLALAILLDGQVVTADRKFHDKIRASPHHPRSRWFMDPPLTASHRL